MDAFRMSSGVRCGYGLLLLRAHNFLYARFPQTGETLSEALRGPLPVRIYRAHHYTVPLQIAAIIREWGMPGEAFLEDRKSVV